MERAEWVNKKQFINSSSKFTQSQMETQLSNQKSQQTGTEDQSINNNCNNLTNGVKRKKD